MYQRPWCEHVTVGPAHPPQIEQVSQLAALVHAQVEYHSRAAEILTQLSSRIDERLVLTLMVYVLLAVLKITCKISIFLRIEGFCVVHVAG